MSTLSRAPKKLNFSGDPILIEMTTAAALSEDNLTASMTLNEIDGGSPVFQAKLTPPYDAAGKMMADLSNLFDLDIPFPGESMAGGPTLHFGTYRRYKITHSDRYGTPPTENALATSDEFIVIRGATPNFYGFGPDAVSDLQSWYLLHSYYIQDNKEYRRVKKVVSPAQPETLYFWNNTAGSITINWTATIRTTSGLNDSKSGSFILPTEGLYNAFLSYAQIGSTFENVIGYDLEMTSGGKTETIEYILDDAPNDYEYILFYENGIGGMESARFSGRHRKTAAARGVISKAIIWAGFDPKQGQSQKNNIVGGKTLELNSGYYPKEYIEHLGQLLFSDVWIYDTLALKLIRYNVIPSSLKIDDDNELLHNLTIQIRPATEAKSMTTF